ncbi:hypothetical protein FKM82_026027, partial [Ascaphus truei]
GEVSGRTLNGSVPTSHEPPYPLQRKKYLPSIPRLGDGEARGPPSPCSEVDVSRLVSRMQDGGTKTPTKHLNGDLPLTSALTKASPVYPKRGLTRPAAPREGDCDSIGKARSPGERPVISRPPVRPPDPPSRAVVPQKPEPRTEGTLGGKDIPPSVVASRTKFFEKASRPRGR